MTASGYFLYILGLKIINQKPCGQDEKLLKVIILRVSNKSFRRKFEAPTFFHFPANILSGGLLCRGYLMSSSVCA